MHTLVKAAYAQKTTAEIPPRGSKAELEEVQAKLPQEYPREGVLLATVGGPRV